MITQDELMSQVRAQGIEDLAQVKLAGLEGDGRIRMVCRAGAAWRV